MHLLLEQAPCLSRRQLLLQLCGLLQLPLEGEDPAVGLLLCVAAKGGVLSQWQRGGGQECLPCVLTLGACHEARGHMLV